MQDNFVYFQGVRTSVPYAAWMEARAPAECAYVLSDSMDHTVANVSFIFDNLVHILN